MAWPEGTARGERCLRRLAENTEHNLKQRCVLFSAKLRASSQTPREPLRALSVQPGSTWFNMLNSTGALRASQPIEKDHGIAGSPNVRVRWANGIKHPIVERHESNAVTFATDNYPHMRGALVLHLLRDESGDTRIE